MEAIINSCARIFAKATEEAHGQIVGAAVELARVERENELLHLAMRNVMPEASNDWLMSDEAREMGNLVGINPMMIVASRFEQVSL